MKATVMGILILLCMPKLIWANTKFSVEDKLNRMKLDLQLTDEQIKEVRPILEDYRINLEQLSMDKEEQLSKHLSPQQLSEYRNFKSSTSYYRDY